VLLADRQTTGGYPKIGVVISADLPALCRLRPGRELSFSAVDYDEARRAARELEAWIARAKNGMREVAGRSVVNIGALFEHNLIGGVVDAKVPHVH
jgi:allophanate hydrolase subunit 2